MTRLRRILLASAVVSEERDGAHVAANRALLTVAGLEGFALARSNTASLHGGPGGSSLHTLNVRGEGNSTVKVGGMSRSNWATAADSLVVGPD